MQKAVTVKEFIGIAEENLNIAKALLQRNGQLDPILFVFDPQWKLTIVQMLFKDEPDAPMFVFIEAAVAKLRARAFIFLGESWVSEYDMKTDNRPIKDRVRPRDDPNHREAIICAGAHPKHRISWSTLFTRNANGVFVFEPTVRIEEENSTMKDFGGFSRIPLFGLMDEIEQN